jgi:hypothetical protein
LATKFKEAYKHNITDYIQDIADNRNSRISRPIKKTPNEATKDGKHQETYNNLKKSLGKNTDAKDIKVGDKVRVLMFRKNPLEKGYLAQWTKETFKITKHSANGVYLLNKKYGDAKYNANYLRKAKGSEPPPPKAVKPGGMLDKLRLARTAPRDDYAGRVEPRKTRAGTTAASVRSRAAANPATKRQTYKIGGKIRRKFNGVMFQGDIIGFDRKKGWYLIEYTDGDREQMTQKELEKYRFRLKINEK